MDRLFAAAAVFVAAVAMAAESDAPIYSNDFESGLGAWDMTDANAWELAEDEGNAVLSLHGRSRYAPLVRSPHNIAWISGVEVGSLTLEADLKQTGRDYDHRDLCLFFGGQDPSRFYYVHLAKTADEHANSIFLVNDAPRVSIANERTEGTDWGAGWHHVKVERDIETGRIAVYFDDMNSPVMQATDKTFGVGKIGFGSFDDVGYFDNIVVRD